MDQHARIIAPPPAGIAPAAALEPSASRAVVLVRHDGWTPAKQAAFLRALAATHSVALAAREVGMSRQSAYRLRARLKGEPFDLGWDAAFACQYDRLSEAAMERALNGVEVPHYHRGELIGTHRRFDERLTLGLLAMRARAPRRGRPAAHPVQAVADDLAALVDRIETGPETWAEEIAAEERRSAEDAAEAAAARETEWDDEDDDDWDDEFAPRGDGDDEWRAEERRLAALPLPERLAHENKHFMRGFREALAASQGWGPCSRQYKEMMADEDDDEDDDDTDGEPDEELDDDNFSAGTGVTPGDEPIKRDGPRVWAP